MGERERNNKYCFRRILSAEVIDHQPISDDYVYGERGIDERDYAALYDFSPGRCEGRMWNSPAVPSSAPRVIKTDLFLPYRKVIPRVPLNLRYFKYLENSLKNSSSYLIICREPIFVLSCLWGNPGLNRKR